MADSYSANSDMGIGGRDDRTGEDFVLYMMPVGGIGARPTLDGESALINYMGNCSSQPIEVWESMFPFRVREYRLRPRSAGRGFRRGGFGLELAYEAIADNIEVSVFTERQRFAPAGRNGGGPGAAGSYWMEVEGRVGQLPILTKATSMWMQRGDVLVLRTGGGGGYGDPRQREPERVAEDVRQGLISAEDAETDYGVIIGDDGVTDLQATAELRARMEPAGKTVKVTKVAPVDAGPQGCGVTLALGVDQAGAMTLAPDDIALASTADQGVYVRIVEGQEGEVVLGDVAAVCLGAQAGDFVRLEGINRRWETYDLTELYQSLKRDREVTKGKD
jgi:hypothetical protein